MGLSGSIIDYLICPQGRSLRSGSIVNQVDNKIFGRSQNTVPIASTQVAIKGIVQYSTRAQFLVEQLATRHSREHTLSTVGPDMPVE